MKTYHDVLHDALEEGSALTGYDLHKLFEELLEKGDIPPPPISLSTEISEDNYERLKIGFMENMRAIALLQQGGLKVYIIKRKPFDVSRN